MIIRGQQRAMHSDSERVSGRVELAGRGFYFLKYHPNGAKPSDVWDILPEDTQKRSLHFAPTRKTSARFRSLPLARKVELCLTRFAEQERLGWWPSN